MLAAMSTPTHAPPPLDILLVEDHRDARTTMRMLLTLRHGHAVREAADGAAALRLALETRPDVALIDLGLPDMSGHEVARRMRSAPGAEAIVLVAVTGYGSDEDRQRTLESGFDFHLVKPVEGDALEGVFEAARARGRDRNERTAGPTPE
jgi:CheY-like chemotaxis protein